MSIWWQILNSVSLIQILLLFPLKFSFQTHWYNPTLGIVVDEILEIHSTSSFLPINNSDGLYLHHGRSDAQ